MYTLIGQYTGPESEDAFQYKNFGDKGMKYTVDAFLYHEGQDKPLRILTKGHTVHFGPNEVPTEEEFQSYLVGLLTRSIENGLRISTGLIPIDNIEIKVQREKQ